MKQTRTIMGMHITIEVVDRKVTQADIDKIYAYFDSVDQRFSTYKKDSEISKINKGELTQEKYSAQMKKILEISEQTKKETNGYFDIDHNGYIDPSGIVKGWAIWNAAKMLKKAGFENYYVDAGGDVEVAGKNEDRLDWTIGIRNPFNPDEIVKVLRLSNKGIATSGTQMRGQHIYNPHKPNHQITDIMSITIVGPNVLEADRFATAAFAMGVEGIRFVEKLDGFEGYMIDKSGTATYTSGFDSYVNKTIHSNATL